jgi:hypothetical protein
MEAEEVEGGAGVALCWRGPGPIHFVVSLYDAICSLCAVECCARALSSFSVGQSGTSCNWCASSRMPTWHLSWSTLASHKGGSGGLRATRGHCMQRWRCCVTLPFRPPDVSYAVHSIISAPADVDADCCRPALMVSVNGVMLRSCA